GRHGALARQHRPRVRLRPDRRRGLLLRHGVPRRADPGATRPRRWPVAARPGRLPATAGVRGLAEAHAAGLVLRGLQPGNVIIATLGGQRDVAKLLDFGLVQDLSANPDTRLTRTGTVLGTPAYMSPEQAAGESEVDARSDVYSLGAVAFFALTGRPPFQG